MTSSTVSKYGIRPPGADQRSARCWRTGPSGRFGLSAEEIIQVAVQAVFDDRANGLERALLGVARGAGITENVVGDPVDVFGIAADHRRVLVELGRALAESVLGVAVLVHVGELLGNADVTQQPDGRAERRLGGLDVGHA